MKIILLDVKNKVLNIVRK